MLTLEPARTDQHYDALLELVYHQRTAYLDPLLDLIALTGEQFGQYFRATGVAYRVCLDGELVGICWIKIHQPVLSLLGLVIQTERQGAGLGAQVLAWLEEHAPPGIASVELQVHVSNPRARALYERVGYRQAAYDPASGFFTMRKALEPGSRGDCAAESVTAGMDTREEAARRRA
jgi:ribosomal protein S18 acetylase RimI-like enzyme